MLLGSLGLTVDGLLHVLGGVLGGLLGGLGSVL